MDRKDAGFTLVELLTVLTVLALLLTLGLPAFSGVLARQRVAGALHLLSADMAMARATAVMRREPVVVCPRDASGACAGSRDWSGGWMVFRDPDGNRSPDTAGHVLRLSDPPGGGALALPASRTLLRYQPDGRSANSNLTVYVCAGPSYGGKVVVNNLGRVRSERADPAAPCPVE